jgi:hypothetical protein
MRLASAAVVLIIGVSPVRLAAQGGFRWPENPKNLKALPEGTGGQRLGQIMRGFALGLGVRCEYCHKGEGGDLSQFDFASDEKPTKEKARLMIKMVQAINGTHLAGLADLGVPDDKRIRVTCVTCHHGLTRPMTLESVLAATADSAGADAAIAQYHDLRNRYYGGFAYDFSRGSLTRVAEGLIQGKKFADAAKFLELELATNGEDVRTLVTFGSALVQAGERDRGMATLQRALALAPDNAKRFVQAEIDRLSKP